MLNFDKVKDVDPEVYEQIIAEYNRQNNGIELIASENIPSEAVLQAQSSYHTLKYAEGYPDKRYYGGCKNVDKTEKLAIQRVCKLFGCKYANVQPHSGAQANESAYVAVLKQGDRVMGMSINSGGHISHFSKASAQSRFYEVEQYEVDPQTFLLNYEEIEKQALNFMPRLVVVGASAYPRIIDFERFREIVDKINEKLKKYIDSYVYPDEYKQKLYDEEKCYLMADVSHIAGLIVTGLHPNPFPYADIVTSTTHKTLRGTRGGIILTNDETLSKKINSAVFPKVQGGPLEHIIAAKAVCFYEDLKPEFKDYQKQVILNAKALADTLLKNEINLVTGGTDNHLILIDLRGSGITGKELEDRLGEVGITVNKNAIPFDTENKNTTSGIRIGTPAVTSRGMKENEMVVIGNLIANTIKNFDKTKDDTKKEVQELCKKFPLYR